MSPTYAELEALYRAQCKCADAWADKYNAVMHKTADATLQAKVDELEAALAVVNSRLAAAQAAPMPVFELNEGHGWDFVEGVDSDWIMTLPYGTKLYYLGDK